MTSFALKLIAIITMTIDHFAGIVGQGGLVKLLPGVPLSVIHTLDAVMHCIGRMAFPLFAFMIAEGCRKTKNEKRYVGRLALFAVISEPFFYFSAAYNREQGFSGLLESLIHLNFTNVFFTLTIAAGAVLLCRKLEQKRPETGGLLFVPVILAAGGIAQLVNTDYGMAGVVLIAALYFAAARPSQIFLVLLWSVCLYGFGTLMETAPSWQQIGYAWGLTAGAALSCLFIWLYNGERGKKAKWIFYVYYPAHLFLLTMASCCLMG